ncbi:MAG: YbhB/YbcL family Raf kinase inhibitor-like protein [Candidatus Saganbacteria bacterium]|nr:YbhB/YbcL family Raf kinase inhibitor-like protein [Candidatus Saganbacteria bacterium]
MKKLLLSVCLLSFLAIVLILNGGCSTTSGGGGTTTSFAVTSTAFTNGGAIPTAYAYTSITGGLNTSLPLSWSDAPSGTNYFAIHMVDTSASFSNFCHWMVINIPSTIESLAAGASQSSMPTGSSELYNNYGEYGYGGPAPPSGEGAHNYVITIYALSGTLSFSVDNPTYAEFTTAVAAKNLGSAAITGTFSD